MKDYLKQNYVISRFKKQYNGRVLKTFSAQLENMVNNIYNQVTRWFWRWVKNSTHWIM